VSWIRLEPESGSWIWLGVGIDSRYVDISGPAHSYTLGDSPLELTAGLLQVTGILEVTGLPEVNGLLAVAARVQYYTNTGILKSGPNV
jgi:hypothetical protein